MLDEPALRTAMQPVISRCPSGNDVGAVVDIDGAVRDAMCERRRQVGAVIAQIHDVDEFAPGAYWLKETEAGIPRIWIDAMNSLGWLLFGVVAHTGDEHHKRVAARKRKIVGN